MCGKYGGPAELEVFAGYLKVLPPFKRMDSVEERRPMRMVEVFARNAQGENVVKEMRWGLIPSYYTGHISDWRASTLHACLETVARLSSFEKAWARKRRVIFPMHYFNEKLDPDSTLPGAAQRNVRVNITRADRKPLAVAGIYDYAQTADGPILSVAMLTRAPGPRMLNIHKREPVVIEPEDCESWLDGADLDLAKPWADTAFEVRYAGNSGFASQVDGALSLIRQA